MTLDRGGLGGVLVAAVIAVAAACQSSPGALPGDVCEDRADGTACTLDDGCVRSAECRGGSCVAVETRSCPAAGDPCLVASCEMGECVELPVPDGTACDDGSLCTESDACVSGVCTGDPVTCEASGLCRIATCDPAVGCVETQAEDGVRCDDGNRCTFGEQCEAGECVPSREQSCPRTQCQLANRCEPTTGLCVPTNVPDGTPCDDRNLCTEGDACFDGICEPARAADRGTPCSQGICFTEVSAQVGVDYAPDVHQFNHGAGVAAADFDGDGDVDLFLAQELAQPKLYLNRGDGTFVDATDSAGFPELNLFRGVFQGVTAADYDNDGDVDVLAFHETENKLYRNRGDATFEEVSEQAGIARLRWSVGGAFADLDLDGDLDLVVGNYILPPSVFPFHNPEKNAVFRNEGDGTFTELDGGAGMHASKAGATLTVVSTDFDGDGLPDIVECNDFGQTVTPNRWFKNVSVPGGDIVLEEVADQLGTDVELFCMNTALGDFDRDRDLDVYHTNIGAHALLRNDGDRYVDVAVQTGTDVTRESCQPHLFSAGWAAGFRDFDSDGWLDLFAASGFVMTDPDLDNAEDAEDKLFKNTGAAPWFEDISATAGVTNQGRARGAAFADLDGDGDEDIVVTNMEGPVLIYRNDSPQGNWIRFDFEGTVSNRDGYHARAQLWDDGGREYVFESTPYSAYQSMPAPSVHVGLGDAAAVDRVRVRWPSGVEQQIFHPSLATEHLMVEPPFRVDGTVTSKAGGLSVEVELELLQAVPSVTARVLRNDQVLADRTWEEDAAGPGTLEQTFQISGTDPVRLEVAAGRSVHQLQLSAATP